MYWPSDECGAGSAWAAWFANYQAMVLHYARLAAELDVDAFLISHELETANSACPALWAGLLAAVRGVYKGKVSAAFQPSLLEPAVLATAPYAAALDFVGIDCYLEIPLPNAYNGTNHPALPWQDVAQAPLNAALASLMAPFANLSAALGGLPIVCTEVGWQSRPWSYTGRAGIVRPDQEDCSVWDQCVSADAQAMAYAAFFAAYYPQPWFDGVLFWTWRADPTAGGTSDDGFSPNAKSTAEVLMANWLPA
jgi:hypothetical protein